MPASMMSAEAGGRPKVKGSSIATVVSGEMPGNTPTSVPIMTPAKQNSRFCQLAAVARPSARLSNSSTPPSPELERQTETPDEQPGRERRPRPRGRGPPGHPPRPHAGSNQAERGEQHREQRDRRQDHHQRPPRQS